jgi:hypothetical protein
MRLILAMIGCLVLAGCIVGDEEDARKVLHVGVDWGYECVEFNRTREECHKHINETMGWAK